MITLATNAVSSVDDDVRRLGTTHPWLILAVVATICITWAVTNKSSMIASRPLAAKLSDRQLDIDLQKAAENALANQKSEGAIIVIDPQTGRIRAIANSKLVFQEMFSPGSTIKPFVTLAALQNGLIDNQYRLSCPGGYSNREFHSACSHPRDLPSLNSSDAIAYSCNHFFGSLGERLESRELDSVLMDFGFGKVTGAGDLNESAGRLLTREWKPQDAMGDGQHLLVTPIQLITAYTALINGGHLFKPWTVDDSKTDQVEKADLMIEPEHRSILIEGMREAVRSGTARDSQLNSLPLYIFGKTGTSTETGGFRTQGWFVGFASFPGEGNDSPSRPQDIRLGVLVFLRRAHGAQAAAVSRSIFEKFAEAPDSTSQMMAIANSSSVTTPTIRVHLQKENRSLTLPLEDYVARVVSVEGSMEDEPEALKALAVASRTFALKNLRRHDRDGYDFCSTTHCQRFSATNAVSTRVRNAVEQTAGQTLQDGRGDTIDAYFSASCGGATANIKDLWGVTAPAYLKGVTDDYCAGMPHAHWQDVISNVDLLRALQQDDRTNVGKYLRSIRIVRRDSSGRAQTILLDGESRKLINGWEFKIIVGRALGWEFIKSSRFDVKKSATNYIFIGSGFGHGLGLCQEGAHVMARRGANYQQILAKYFPGTSVDGIMKEFLGDLIWNDVKTKLAKPAGTFRVLSSENFQMTYPTVLNSKDADSLLRLLEYNRNELLTRAASSGVRTTVPTINVFVNDTTGNFVGRTGQPPWAAAATKDNLIELQPLAQLQQRGILKTTIRHELAHAIIKTLARREIPRWLEEGFALYLAGEGPKIVRYASPKPQTSAAIEKAFEQRRGKEEMRTAYSDAYGLVNRLVQKEGEAAVWLRIADG